MPHLTDTRALDKVNERPHTSFEGMRPQVNDEGDLGDSAGVHRLRFAIAGYELSASECPRSIPS
jgi:hypothetical protein